MSAFQKYSESAAIKWLLIIWLSLLAFSAEAKRGLWLSPGEEQTVQVDKTQLFCMQWEGTSAWLARHRADRFNTPLFWLFPVRPEFSSASRYKGGLHTAAEQFAAPALIAAPQPRPCRPSAPIEVLNAFDYYAGGPKPAPTPKAFYAEADAADLPASLRFKQWRAGAYVKAVLAHLKFNRIDVSRDVRRRLQEWESSGYGLALIAFEPTSRTVSGGWLPPVQLDFAVALDLRENWLLLESDKMNSAKLEMYFMFGEKRAAPALETVAFPTDHFLPAETANIFSDLAQEIQRRLWRNQQAYAACLLRAADLTPKRWTPAVLAEENARYKRLIDSLASFAGGARWLPGELHFSCWAFGGKLAEPRGLKIQLQEYRPPFRVRYYFREALLLPEDAPMRDRCARKAAYEAKVAQENLMRLAGWKARKKNRR